MNSICDVCGAEFYIDHIEERFDTMDGEEYVQVLYFKCPECGNEYVISVLDDEAIRLREQWSESHEVYRESYDIDLNSEEIARKCTERSWNKLVNYSNRLKRRYLKEQKNGIL